MWKRDQIVGRDLASQACLAARLGLKHLLGNEPKVISQDSLELSESEVRFDYVIGNPPFLNQLKLATASADRLDVLEKLGIERRGYMDSSSVFLLLAHLLTKDGGRCAMLLPDSFLAARDSGPVREYLREHSSLFGLWYGRQTVFDAGVHVIAPIFEKTTGQGKVERWVGPSFEPAKAASLEPNSSMGSLVADLEGVP